MAGPVGGSEDINTSSPLTNQTQIKAPTGNNGTHNIQQTNVPNQLSGLAPNETSQKPVGDRDPTPVDNATPTPGLSKPSGEKDLPALEKEREDMLKEAGDLAGKHEELYVLAHALRAVAPPDKYPDKLAKAPGLKVTLQMTPGGEVYSLEPPDEAFKALPKEEQEKMKAMAYDLLINHNNTKFKGFDLPASKKRLEELKEQLEKNGNEIGAKGGNNNWRESYQKLEHKPAYIVVSSDSGTSASATAPKQKEKPQPQASVTPTSEPQEPVPPISGPQESVTPAPGLPDNDSGDVPPPSGKVPVSNVDPVSGTSTITNFGKITVVEGDITQLKDQLGIEVDAVTNAANERLEEGTGVCGSIFAAAGRAELKAECEERGGHCPAGEVRTTESYGLESQGAKYIIHAVAPDKNQAVFARDHERTLGILANSYRNIMREAEALKLEKIAIPLLGAGAFGIPGDQSAEVAAKVIQQYQTSRPDAPEVVFVFYPDGGQQGQQNQQARERFEAMLTDGEE